jgi:hypothetical protein
VTGEIFCRKQYGSLVRFATLNAGKKLGKYVTDVLLNYKCKGKAIPLQGWTGPEGSKRLRFPDFKTVGT